MLEPPSSWRRYDSSIMLVATFFLGVVVGGAMTYALVMGRPAPQDTPAKPAEAPAPQAAAPPAPPSAADVDGVWPGRHLILTVAGKTLTPDEAKLLAEFKPAGVLLRAQNIESAEQTRALAQAVKAAEGLGEARGDAPFIAYSEGAGGPLKPLGLNDAPSPQAVAGLSDAVAAQRLGRQWADAARAHGVDVFFGPRLDVFVDGTSDAAARSGYLGDEPDAVLRAGLAVADGLRSGGVIPVALHYPGMGLAMADPAGGWVVPEQDLGRIATAMLPFQQAAQQNIAGILVSHVMVPAIHPDEAARPASASAKLIGKTLRETWKYGGVVIADDFSALSGEYRRREVHTFVESLLAGCDLVVVSNADRDRVQDLAREVLRAVQSNTLPKTVLADSKVRIARWFERLAAMPAAAPALEAPAPDETPSEAPTPEVDASPSAAEEKEPPKKPENIEADKVAPPADSEVKSHTVKKGETLTSIAAQYKVELRELRAWNGLRDGEIQAGKKLTVYVPRKTTEAEAVTGDQSKEDAAAGGHEAAGGQASARAETPTEPPTKQELPEAAPPANVVDAPAQSETPKSILVEHESPKAEADTKTPNESSETAPAATPSESPSPAPTETGAMPAEPAAEKKSEAAVETPAREDARPPVDTPPPADAQPPAAAAPAAQPANTDRREFVVKDGQALSDLANQFGVSAEDLQKWNGLADATVNPGQKLVVYLPVAQDAPDYARHVITRGDTLHKIAVRYNTTAEELIRINRLKDPNGILIGQSLKVPKNH